MTASSANQDEHAERKLAFSLPDPAQVVDQSPGAVSLIGVDLHPHESVWMLESQNDRFLFVHGGSGRVEFDDGEVVKLPDEIPMAVFLPAGSAMLLGSSTAGLHGVLGEAARSCDVHAPLGEIDRVRRVDDATDDQATSKRAFSTLFGPENGSTRATMFVGHVPPGQAPWHFHQYDEMVWIWQGQGRFRLNGSQEAVGPGSIFRIRPRQVHIVANDGDNDLLLVGLFTPAGSPAAAYLAGPRR